MGTCQGCRERNADGCVLTACSREHVNMLRLCQVCRMAYWMGMDMQCYCGAVLMEWATKQDVEKEWLKSY